MPIVEVVAVSILALGALLFLVAAVGLVRLPDNLSRLHALTKADNLGLALIAVGSSLLAYDWSAVAKLWAIWFFVAATSAVAAFLIAGSVLRQAGGRES